MIISTDRVPLTGDIRIWKMDRKSRICERIHTEYPDKTRNGAKYQKTTNTENEIRFTRVVMFVLLHFGIHRLVCVRK